MSGNHPSELSPRQRMINMMYLVLTALLALNVSKEVLQSFFEVNKGIERTTTNFNFENTESFIQVMCRNYSKESGRTHSLNVEIWSDKYTKYRKTL